MSYDDIRTMPSTITPEMMRGTRGVHQSRLQSYHILAKVKELLDKGTDPTVVRELIWMMETPIPEKEQPR